VLAAIGVDDFQMVNDNDELLAKQTEMIAEFQKARKLDQPPGLIKLAWRRFNCRYRSRHHWIDTDGDGITDACSICGRKPI
jgi:hypothetical protein